MSLGRAQEVLRIEAKAIAEVAKKLDKDFLRALRIMQQCRGRIVVTGMGKAGLIGQKISATLASTGSPSLFLHSAEAIHGDLGRVRAEDVVLILSNSGETEEVRKLLPFVKKIGAQVIAVTGRRQSTLARFADVILDAGVKREACPLNLAPTASTTAMLALGDALAICLLERKGFKEEDFALYHPGGALGKKLHLKVRDLMRTGAANPVVKEDKRVKEVLVAITEARAGAASVVDRHGRLTGIFTDGDLRRHLEEKPDLLRCKVKEVMTLRPLVVSQDSLAVKVLRILEDHKIDELPVVDNQNRPVGMLDIQDLLRAGLV